MKSFFRKSDRSYRIDTLIYKLYFFCIPFGQLFNLPFNEVVHPFIPEYSMIIMLFGLMILVTSSGIRFSKRLSNLWYIYAICVGLSILMAFVLSTMQEGFKESPYHAIIGDIVLYLIFVLSVCYNSYALTHFIRFKDLIPVMNAQLVVLLTVGYLQFYALNEFGIATVIYERLARVFALTDITWITNLERGVTFFGTEVASASLLCYLLIPFNIVRTFSTKGWVRFRYAVSLILFSVLFLTSGSSSALISFLVVAGVYALIRIRIPVKAIMLSSFVAGMVIAIIYSVSFGYGTKRGSEDDRSAFNYVLMGKLFDTENRSTLTRASTVINDMKIFYDMPITGCGNGNQGFYYNENVPSWMDESDEIIMIRKTVPNGGGNFFPSYLSGFGLLGVVFLLLFIIRYQKWINNSILRKEEELYLIYCLGITLFLVSSWYVVSLKQSEAVAFLFCLPFIQYSRNTNQ